MRHKTETIEFDLLVTCKLVFKMKMNLQNLLSLCLLSFVETGPTVIEATCKNRRKTDYNDILGRDIPQMR
jgi:hypothetical protein